MLHNLFATFSPLPTCGFTITPMLSVLKLLPPSKMSLPSRRASLMEITRLGLALNANPLTFSGLAGMGDLIVTAFSPYSRNHQLGLLVGKGKDARTAQAELTGVAEGAVTALTGRELAHQMRVEMPITEEVYRILYQGTQPLESIERLLSRPLKKEFY
jgi:glycerol-3-phosphate dehydrogenase (NAD(P)+)